MLKLEKNKRTKEVHIAIRIQEGFWSPNLFMAIGIALFIHMFAAVAISIKPFRITFEQTVFPPLEVDISDGAIEAMISMNMEKEFRWKDKMEPPGAILSLPVPSVHQPQLLLEVHHSSDELFGKLERERLYTSFPFTPEQSPERTSPLRIHGPLAERHLLAYPEGALFNDDFGVVSFQVQVNDEDGTVFWYKLRRSSGREETDLKAQKILASIVFTPLQDSFITKGEVEIIFQQRGKNDRTF